MFHAASLRSPRTQPELLSSAATLQPLSVVGAKLQTTRDAIRLLGSC